MRSLKVLKFLALFLVAGCVSIVINFPAAEVKKAADKIESEVRGTPTGSPATDAMPQARPQSSLPPLSFGGIAYADANLNVDSPAVRSITAERKARFPQLTPHLESGALCEGKDGLLKIRAEAQLDARSRVAVKRLVDDENKNRMDLYNEINALNKLNDVGAIQKQFAKSIREKVPAGQFYEDDGGNCVKK